MENKDYVSYEQALKLKECGFDVPCSHYYFRNSTLRWSNPGDNYNEASDFCSAPTLWEAQKWLRETHNIHVLPHLESVNRPQYVCHITHLRKSSMRLTDDARYFDTYESALSSGIGAALEILGKKRHL